MRYDYRKVVNHNARSGNNATTCSYYNELHSILRGDATIRPKRVSSSLKICRTSIHENDDHENIRAVRTSATVSNASQQYHEDNTASDIISSDDIEDNNPQAPYNEDIGSQGTSNACSADDEEEFTNHSSSQEDTSMEDCTVQGESVINNVKATLSPASRIAILRNRKNRRAGQQTAERIMKHCSMENSRIISIMHSDSTVFEKYIAHSIKQEQILTQQREAMLNCIQKTANILEKISNIICCNKEIPTYNETQISMEHSLMNHSYSEIPSGICESQGESIVVEQNFQNTPQKSSLPCLVPNVILRGQ